jgi:hypothetical protein
MPFEVITSQIKNNRDEILSELRYSLESKNVVGIILKESHELITTAVAALEEDATGDYIIQLMDQDLHGFPIDRNVLLLSSIERIIHFSISFNDPQYVRERRKEKFKT